MSRPRVLLADDHPATLDSFRAILQAEYDVVESVSDGAAALAAARRHQPDVSVMDISMPGLSGIEVCRQLRRSVPQARVVIASTHDDLAYVTGAFHAGACGYVLKDRAALELPLALRLALDGQAHLTPSLRLKLWDDRTTGPERLAGLTARQRQLVTMVGLGMSTKEIASAMGIAFKTAVRRRDAAMRALGIQQNSDLMRYAIRCRMPDLG